MSVRDRSNGHAIRVRQRLLLIEDAARDCISAPIGIAHMASTRTCPRRAQRPLCLRRGEGRYITRDQRGTADSFPRRKER
jgi:hypothetical protein